MDLNEYQILDETAGEKTTTVNRQLWENSEARTAPDNLAAVDSEDALFGRRDPNLGVLHEKIEHRIAILYKAQGKSNREIAARTGYTEPWVSQLFRQPWAQARLIKEISDAGRPVLDQLFAGAAADSVYTLIKERDSATNKSADRISASKELLDRFLGKAPQTIEQTVKVSSGDIESVEKELAELRGEEARLTGQVVDTVPRSGVMAGPQ